MYPPAAAAASSIQHMCFDVYHTRERRVKRKKKEAKLEEILISPHTLNTTIDVVRDQACHVGSGHCSRLGYWLKWQVWARLTRLIRNFGRLDHSIWSAWPLESAAAAAASSDFGAAALFSFHQMQWRCHTWRLHSMHAQNDENERVQRPLLLGWPLSGHGLICYPLEKLARIATWNQAAESGSSESDLVVHRLRRVPCDQNNCGKNLDSGSEADSRIVTMAAGRGRIKMVSFWIPKEIGDQFCVSNFFGLSQWQIWIMGRRRSECINKQRHDR